MIKDLPVNESHFFQQVILIIIAVIIKISFRVCVKRRYPLPDTGNNAFQVIWTG
jgi:hypothetical protein